MYGSHPEEWVEAQWELSGESSRHGWEAPNARLKENGTLEDLS